MRYVLSSVVKILGCLELERINLTNFYALFATEQSKVEMDIRNSV